MGFTRDPGTGENVLYGKMNAVAQVRTSVEMEKQGIITKAQALLRVAPESLEQMLFPRLDPKAKVTAVASGLPASPGAASGIAVFDADRAEMLGKEQGFKVILVREETKPEDIHGFFASEGILTSRGGKTSHAAVVARGMGKCCVAGAEGIHVDVEKRIAIVGDTSFKEGDMIVADTQEERQEALDRLLPLQQKDFKALFEVMSPYPVVIRLLDPPIHEFLPNEAVLERMGWCARSPSCSSWPRTPTA